MPELSHEPVNVEPIPYRVLSTVKAKDINWLWKPYIPKGGLTTIIGDGGYGKSYMTCAIAADLSTGRALPGQDPLPPQKVMMISAEDGLEPVILPRLQKLEANLENIAVYDEGFTVNPTMTKRIIAALDQFDAAVLFLDPLVVYLGGEIDSFKANEVRSVLTQINAIAKAKEIAVVCVHHVKKGHAQGQHKSLGSVDFVNGVRSTVLVDVSKTGTYFMSHVKHNWSGKGQTRAYSFDNDRFYWMGIYEPVVGHQYEISKTPRGKARAFLINVLRNGPVLMSEVMARAKDEGFTEGTIQRAKHGTCHSLKRPDAWYWELDPEAQPPLETRVQPALTEMAAMARLAPETVVHASIPEPEADLAQLLANAQAALAKPQGA